MTVLVVPEDFFKGDIKQSGNKLHSRKRIKQNIGHANVCNFQRNATYECSSSEYKNVNLKRNGVHIIAMSHFPW